MQADCDSVDNYLPHFHDRYFVFKAPFRSTNQPFHTLDCGCPSQDELETMYWCTDPALGVPSQGLTWNGFTLALHSMEIYCFTCDIKDNTGLKLFCSKMVSASCRCQLGLFRPSGPQPSLKPLLELHSTVAEITVLLSIVIFIAIRPRTWLVMKHKAKIIFLHWNFCSASCWFSFGH